MSHLLKIALVDTQQLFLDSLATALKNIPYIESVLCCSSYSKLQSVITQNEPHLIFLALNLGTTRYNGFTICRDIKGRLKHIFVAILTQYNNEIYILRAIECGANAYIVKSIDIESLKNFIDNFREGKCARFYKYNSGQTHDEKSEFGTDVFELKQQLTKRELEIFELIVQGLENEEIQKRLAISYDTFRTHRDKIFKKLGVKNIAQLVNFALLNQLKEPSYLPGPLIRQATPTTKGGSASPALRLGGKIKI